MSTELNYPEEYKTLRIEEYKTLSEEIAMCQREIHRTWLWASIGSAVVYTSVYLHRTELPPDPHLHLIWFIPPVLVLFCCIRYFAFWLRIRRQARYILELEKKAFPVEPSGAAHWNDGRDSWALLVALGIWLILICSSVYVSWAVWRDPPPATPHSDGARWEYKVIPTRVTESEGVINAAVNEGWMLQSASYDPNGTVFVVMERHKKRQ